MKSCGSPGPWRFLPKSLPKVALATDAAVEAADVRRVDVDMAVEAEGVEAAAAGLAVAVAAAAVAVFGLDLSASANRRLRRRVEHGIDSLSHGRRRLL